MTEKENKTLADLIGKFPPKDLPVIYADNAPITGRGNGTVKFYLIRSDPSLTADGSNNPHLVAQVVMPINGFVATAVFFEDELSNMVAGGELKADFVEEMRDTYRKRREERDAKRS